MLPQGKTLEGQKQLWELLRPLDTFGAAACVFWLVEIGWALGRVGVCSITALGGCGILLADGFCEASCGIFVLSSGMCMIILLLS